MSLATQSLRDALKQRAATRTGGGEENPWPWLVDLRAAALARFAAAGLPAPRDEAWRFTSLHDVENSAFTLAPAGVPAALPPALVPDADRAGRVALVHGRLMDSVRALPGGGVVCGLAQALASHGDTLRACLGRSPALAGNALAALNTVALDDAVVVLVPPGVTVPGVLEITALGPTGAAPWLWAPRLLVVLGEGSGLTLLEHHSGSGAGDGLAVPVTEITLGRGAVLHHQRLQDEAPGVTHLAVAAVRVGAGAAYHATSLSVGARLARHETCVTLEGEEAQSRQESVALVRGRQLADTTARVDHLVPRGTSVQTFKAVIDDYARAVFQGLTKVHPDAQLSDGRQSSRALLLSEHGQINQKPELEIFADDVKCAHGATVGELDEEALFYLRSRGIDVPSARALLVEAFIGETLDNIENATVRAALRRRARAWLGQEGEE